MTRLVETIHAAGAKAAIQLGHGGGHTRVDIAGVTPVAPSAIPHRVQEGHTEVIVPEEMSLSRVAEAVEAFAAAARRAARAGFDAVEIHAAHGYLISQFLAPLENRRTDRYGGPLDNRTRFGNEIVHAIKAAVPHLAVIFRMNGDDFFEGGLTPDEAVEVAAQAAEAGADAIHVTGGHYRSQPTAAIMIPPMATAPTPFAGFARRIRERVPVPVVTVGRYGDPRDAARALSDGTADFVALGRPLLADPLWVEKAARGETVRLLHRLQHLRRRNARGRAAALLRQSEDRPRARLGRPEAAPARAEDRGHRGRPGGTDLRGGSRGRQRGDRVRRETDIGGAFRLAGLAPRFQGVEARRIPLSLSSRASRHGAASSARPSSSGRILSAIRRVSEGSISRDRDRRELSGWARAGGRRGAPHRPRPTLAAPPDRGMGRRSRLVLLPGAVGDRGNREGSPARRDLRRNHRRRAFAGQGRCRDHLGLPRGLRVGT